MSGLQGVQEAQLERDRDERGQRERHAGRIEMHGAEYRR